MITPELLSESPLFTGLPRDHLAPFAALAQEITCARGEALFREGEVASHLYLLRDGKINVQVTLTSLTQPLTIVSLSTFGQLVGWSGFMPPHYYTAAAICQVDSRLLAFEGETFNHLLEADPAVGFTIMRRIADVISERLRNIQRIVLKSLYQDEQ